MFEYGDFPTALDADTRSRYVDRDFTPVSVQDFAVAANRATATNAVHELPLQRCIVIDVALVAVLIHVRLILPRVLELAARFVGAVGTLDAPVVTLMVTEVVFDAPPLSVTVTFAT
jgi:hypothetical protein